MKKQTLPPVTCSECGKPATCTMALYISPLRTGKASPTDAYRSVYGAFCDACLRASISIRISVSTGEGSR